MSANPLLSIEGLTASVDEKTILHNVNLNVAAGETARTSPSSPPTSVRAPACS